MNEIVELMDAWNKVMAIVNEKYPRLSEEAKYKMCESVMFEQLGM